VKSEKSAAATERSDTIVTNVNAIIVIASMMTEMNTIMSKNNGIEESEKRRVIARVILLKTRHRRQR
jgi:hypothetical protein